MNAPELPLKRLIANPPSLEIQVLACVIAESARLGVRPLIRGLDAAAFAQLRDACLPGLMLENGAAPESPEDEFADLRDLLLDHASPRDALAQWLACAIATAAQRDNHLWQDMGLPSRRELSAILQQRFGSLAALNVGDMKWKKFFYRQLCQRAEVLICKSPSCAVCCDYAVCFGPEQ